MEIPKEILEFEDGFAAFALETSKNRRMAQDELMEMSGISRAEAHAILNSTNTPTPEVLDLQLKYGYNLVVNGVSFVGYATGPMTVGGLDGQRIAAERGSYDPATGLLTDETEDGARRYSSHITSNAVYNAGIAVIRITNPGSGKPIVEVTYPEPKE